MSVFIPLPTFNVDFCAPAGVAYDVVGGGTDGGRDVHGNSSAINFGGGGRITAEFRGCNIFEPEQHEYINMIRTRMNGSYRNINVPIMSDFMGPFASLYASGITHSDGSLFSDSSGYSQATVFGTFAAGAALNAGQITVNIYGANRHLRWSDWMSVLHPTKGWRAFSYWECSDPVEVSETIDGTLYEGYQYLIAIDPPLREATVAGDRIELVRPRFVARFPRDFTLPYSAEGTYVSTPTIRFIEP